MVTYCSSNNKFATQKVLSLGATWESVSHVRMLVDRVNDENSIRLLKHTRSKSIMDNKIIKFKLDPLDE